MIATSYVLITVSMGKARTVYDKLNRIPNIERADAITGPYDIVATVQGSDYNHIARTVIEKIQTIEGVTNTITCNIVNFEV